MPERLARNNVTTHNGTGDYRGIDGKPLAKVHNHHPTVKPVRLMRWLCRLVTPPGGLVVDPFLGSGTTGIAATLEGFRFVGSEREVDYHRIAVARIAHAQRYPEAWADTAPGRQDEAVEEVEELERMGQGRLFGGGE